MRGAEVGIEGFDGAGGIGATCAGGVFTTPVTGSGVVAPCIDTSFCLAGSFATAAKCSARPSATDAFFEGRDARKCLHRTTPKISWSGQAFGGSRGQ